MKLVTLISEMYNPHMEEVKKQFKDVLGQKLGQGDNGEAYLHAKDNSKVMKFTTDAEEADIAEVVMGLGDKLKAFNKIHEVMLFSDEETDKQERGYKDEKDEEDPNKNPSQPKTKESIWVIKSDYCRMANIENEEYLQFQKTVEKECKDNAIAFDELDISKDNIRRHPTSDKLVLIDF